MIKAKEISTKNMVVLLMLSLVVSAGYFIARPHAVTSKSIPVFMGEEIVVQKAAAAAGAVAAVPMPAPKMTAPLPIIPPSVTSRVLPAYPASALEKGLEGTVLLSVYVGLAGQPERIETRLSSGVAGIDEAAIKAVSQWRFNPASQAGAALASWFEVPFRFEVK